MRVFATTISEQDFPFLILHLNRQDAKNAKNLKKGPDEERLSANSGFLYEDLSNRFLAFLVSWRFKRKMRNVT